ncbi:ECU04_0152 [Encephalitozoon cuniculi GB-M1]|uniref:ECU04_0152 protein n=1 Tax=Encephalitozoon cuniculi (strain GB-M1) TaxID=284813 RepID=A0A1T5PD67_ENCCU|nr:uncharacterized protein ECU04_0152 [Encephalitozoon cuniculi GB-M1]UYI27390.1 hypothetical protein J0A71_06g12570 [Encephalitozoon cuniculi]SKD10693.1 ECU04_0152 [Encephalitozoon cuniculi GB-M1]
MDRDEDLFARINEEEMEADVDQAVKNYEIPEIRVIEEFILSHDKLFQDIEKLNN